VVEPETPKVEEAPGDSSIFGFLQEQKTKAAPSTRQFQYSDVDEFSEPEASGVEKEKPKPKNDKYSKYDDFLETLENDVEI